MGECTEEMCTRGIVAVVVAICAIPVQVDSVQVVQSTVVVHDFCFL